MDEIKGDKLSQCKKTTPQETRGCLRIL